MMNDSVAQHFWKSLFRNIFPVGHVLAGSRFKPYNHPQSPAQIYLLTHGQILRETNEFERLVKRLNRKEKSQVTSLSGHFEFIKRGLVAHEEGEEEFLFPALDERYPHLSSSYVFDHDHQTTTIFESILKILNDLYKSSDSELQEELNRRAIIFNSLMRLHVIKENELLLPILYENFTADEQTKIMRKMSEHVPPDIRIPWLSKMFVASGTNDREKLLRALIQVSPPNEFRMIVKMLSNTVKPSEWQILILKIPELHC